MERTHPMDTYSETPMKYSLNLTATGDTVVCLFICLFCLLGFDRSQLFERV